MAKTIGPKEAAARALREAADERPKMRSAGLRMVVNNIPVKTTAGRKAEKQSKATQKYKEAVADLTVDLIKEEKKKRVKAAKAKKPKVDRSDRPFVTSKAVAEFMARPKSKENPLGGASMDEMCEHFGIKEHPMRAKIHHARKKMGLNVELVSRYYNRGPAKEGE